MFAEVLMVLSTFQVCPIHCILVHFPLRSEKYLSGFSHVVRFVFLSFAHGTHCREEYGFSVDISLLQSDLIYNRNAVMGRTNVIKCDQYNCTRFPQCPAQIDQPCFLQSGLEWHACEECNRKESKQYCSLFVLRPFSW